MREKVIALHRNAWCARVSDKCNLLTSPIFTKSFKLLLIGKPVVAFIASAICYVNVTLSLSSFHITIIRIYSVCSAFSSARYCAMCCYTYGHSNSVFARFCFAPLVYDVAWSFDQRNIWKQLFRWNFELYRERVKGTNDGSNRRCSGANVDTKHRSQPIIECNNAQLSSIIIWTLNEWNCEPITK